MIRCCLLLALLLPLPGWAESYSAKVLAVIDGDTVLVLRGAHPVKIRLGDIDAPEKAQPFGDAATTSLTELLAHRRVELDTQAVDRYGRTVAQIFLDGENINAEQVRRGWAWEYSFGHRNDAFRALQDEARQARRGLWAAARPIPPWRWRKRHPHAWTAGVPRQTEADFSCGSKHRCQQMHSCDEAHFYLTHCGVTTLDKDRDGIPCPSLCGAD